MRQVISEEEYNKLSTDEKDEYRKVQRPIHMSHKLKRNLGCPCNSGLKYKKCCLFKKEQVLT